MIPEIGHYALALALVLAAVQGTVPLLGVCRGDEALMDVARAAARGQFLLVAIAFAALTWAFVNSDFSVALVAAHSHTLKPMLYKLTGVWGNHEGSMVLWILILALFGLLVAEFGRALPATLRARALGVHGALGVGFLAFSIFTSNPFTRLNPAPVEGSGLNPLLQDPGLAFHPPFLYLGYVGFSMAFSLAVAALLEGRVDAAWARWVRPWTLLAWISLTIGIALGSWWAYYELGWGGWWFWDPVENASLMPWLAGTALLHSALVVERRNMLASWTILLAIVTFGLSLLGTFLVRSGVLTSVHTFATDPERGVFVLVLLLVVIGGSLVLFALRAPGAVSGGPFAPISREGALVLNNLLLATACAVVLLGTLYPLLVDALDGGKISVGAPFFDMTFGPLMIPLLIACPIGAMMAWKRGDLPGVLGRLWVAAVVAVAVAAVAAGVEARSGILGALGLGLAAWLIAGSVVGIAGQTGLARVPLRDSARRAANLPASAWGTACAHAALGVMVAGITVSSAWQEERILIMRPGDTVELAGYEVEFRGTGLRRGPNYTAVQGSFAVRRGGRVVAALLPENRSYPAERATTTEAAIHTTWLADIYAVLGASDGKGGWTARLYHNPLVPWIWAGAILMAAGGAISLGDRRLRARRRAAPVAVPAP